MSSKSSTSTSASTTADSNSSTSASTAEAEPLEQVQLDVEETDKDEPIQLSEKDSDEENDSEEDEDDDEDDAGEYKGEEGGDDQEEEDGEENTQKKYPLIPTDKVVDDTTTGRKDLKMTELFQLENEELQAYHPKLKQHNYEEIVSRCIIQRDEHGHITDPYHTTIPVLTRYEKARILGTRAKQLNHGATPFVTVPTTMIDGYEIASMELKERMIPFIVRRPLPNGESEYWRVSDLEQIDY